MSDWFKMYEDCVSEDRMQYMLHDHGPMVLNVWIWILSECCRTKSDSIRTVSDIVVTAAAHKLNIKPDVFRGCLDKLRESRYIDYSDVMIRVINWNKMQSEYCRKKSGHTPDSVMTISDNVGQSLPRREESRGEEKRKDPSLPLRAREDDDVLGKTGNGPMDDTESFRGKCKAYDMLLDCPALRISYGNWCNLKDSYPDADFERCANEAILASGQDPSGIRNAWAFIKAYLRNSHNDQEGLKKAKAKKRDKTFEELQAENL